MEKRTEISALGKFGLIDRLTAEFNTVNPETVAAVGSDAAVVDAGGSYSLVSTCLMSEGVDFDLTYFPLKHLGWKAVVAACSDIVAEGGVPKQILLSLGVSAKFSVEHLDEFHVGVRAACEAYRIDLAADDIKASINGLTVAVTAVGIVAKERRVGRGGAQMNDIVCLTGDLGAAYMGLKLLERERIAFEGHPNPHPDFKGKEYILRRYLKPDLRSDITELLAAEGVTPTAMIDVSDGLASDVLQICKASSCGVRLYLDRLAIASETHSFADEIGADPVVAALNGGGDYEIMFTVPLATQERVARIGGIDFIGHITDSLRGTVLVTPDGGELPFTAPGFKS